MKRYAEIFRDSRMTTEDGVLQWGRHTCFTSSISQVFIGTVDGVRLFFPDSPEEGLVLELSSGSRYSFLSENADFLVEACGWICRFISGKSEPGRWQIDFENCSISNLDEPETAGQEDQEPSGTVPDYSQNKTLAGELEQLTAYCRLHDEVDAQALPLLLDIKNNIYAGAVAAQTERYREMIRLSLVNLCNELGLNMLLAEIISAVYRSV